MTRALFICGKARKRSPTAADIVAEWDGFETDFAGLSRDVDEGLFAEQVVGDDVIAMMEVRQKKRLTALFGVLLGQKRVVVLGIPDRFEYMEPALVALLKPKLQKVFDRRIRG